MSKLVLAIAVLASINGIVIGLPKFGQICSSNPLNSIRGCDGAGCGHYLAPRTHGKHYGIDIKCTPGSSVMAPFDAKILRRSRPYSTNVKHNNGLYIEGKKGSDFEGYRAKMFYIDPKRTYGTARKGEVIATSLRFPNSRITQHIHVALYKWINGKYQIINPTKYIH